MKLFLVAGLAILVGAGAASAQSAPPPCEGQFATIRTSKVKSGQMQAFMKAVQDQTAWYRAHGVNDNRQVIARVLPRDGPMNAYSTDEVVTIHMNPPSVTAAGNPARDAAWDSFVKEFRDSSDIEAEKTVCLPRM